MSLMATEALLPYGRALTRADLDAMAPDDGHRYELVDGVLVVTPAPSMRHQDAVLNLAITLRSAMPDHLKVLVAPFDVALADDTVMQPDVLVAAKDALTDRDLPAPPELAVEVLSPSTRGIDLLLKKDRLERAGCPHYWVIDPAEPSIVAWRLEDGAYRQVARRSLHDAFEATEPVRVAFTPADLIE